MWIENVGSLISYPSSSNCNYGVRLKIFNIRKKIEPTMRPALYEVKEKVNLLISRNNIFIARLFNILFQICFRVAGAFNSGTYA